MPGREIGETQISDRLPRSSMLKAHKVLPRPEHNSQVGFVPDHFRPPKSFTLAYTTKGQSITPPLAEQSQVVTLPPTPPDNNQETSRRKGTSEAVVPLLKESRTPANPTSGMSTPLGQLSPPTPDQTPPADCTKSTLDVPRTQHTASSRTDSFKTAREEQDSSDGERPSSSASPHKSPKIKGTGASVLRLDGLGGGPSRKPWRSDQGNAKHEQTPTQNTKGHDLSSRRIRQGTRVFDGHQTEQTVGQHDSLPRKIPSKSTNPQLAVKGSGEVAATDTLCRKDLVRGSSLRERVVHNRETVDRRSAEGFAARISWPLAPDDFSATGMANDIDPRRFSQMSMSSTIVEAMLFEPSPQNPPPLRHKRRVVSLRDQGSTDTPLSTRRLQRVIPLTSQAKSHKTSEFDVLDKSDCTDPKPYSTSAEIEGSREPNSFYYADTANSSSTTSIVSGSLPSRSSSSTVQPRFQPHHQRGMPSRAVALESTDVSKVDTGLHLATPITPYLQFSNSSTCEALEVSEAKAVNIYPHNNESLLVVQQKSRPVSREYEENGVSPKRPALPHILRQAENHGADSPSWKLPEPPALKIIPPTPDVLSPNQEYDRQLREPTKTGKLTSGRALSLVRRALGDRRHSDGFMPSAARYKAVDESTQTAKPRRPLLSGSKDSQLSPFWRPRGFWDDLEGDSEDIKEEFLERGRFDTNNAHPTPRRQRSESVARREDRTMHASEAQTQRRTHTIPALGVQVEFVGWKGIQSRIESMKALTHRRRHNTEHKLAKRRISSPTAVDPYGI